MAGYILGTLLETNIISYLSILLLIIFCTLFIFMPDTPQYLLNNNQREVNFRRIFIIRRNDFVFQKAKESLRFYRNCDSCKRKDENELQDEFEKIQAIAKEDERRKLSDICKCGREAFKEIIII